jgi:hypothetical protein
MKNFLNIYEARKIINKRKIKIFLLYGFAINAFFSFIFCMNVVFVFVVLLFYKQSLFLFVFEQCSLPCLFEFFINQCFGLLLQRCLNWLLPLSRERREGYSFFRM